MCGLLCVLSPGAAALTLNAPAPNFSVRTFDGKVLTLADFRGQVLIINFWATWCGPCKEELPLLNAYYKAASQHGYGLRVLAVTTEDSLPIETLKPLAAMVSFDMARHFQGEYRASNQVPMNFVIDRAGILRYAQAGAFTLDSLNGLLGPMLQQPAPANALPAPEHTALRMN
jgi:thiol-disulfide isomerase/thioredoxin